MPIQPIYQSNQPWDGIRQPVLAKLIIVLNFYSRFFLTPVLAENAYDTVSSKSAVEGLTKDIVLSAVRQGDVLVVETHNFRISSRLNSADLFVCAQDCETLRNQLHQKWFPDTPSENWTPKADIVIHRTVDEFRSALGETSSGASGCVTVKQKHGRVIQRRVDLRADVPDWSNSSLSHEMMHLIVVEHFGERQLPRWADEGMAVLAESREKQFEREKAATGCTSLSLPRLLAFDVYPTGSERAAFYAKSASLTAFLINRGGCDRFVMFIEQSMEVGYERALRENYNLNGICGLDREWNARMQN